MLQCEGRPRRLRRSTYFGKCYAVSAVLITPFHLQVCSGRTECLAIVAQRSTRLGESLLSRLHIMYDTSFRFYDTPLCISTEVANVDTKTDL